MKSIKNKCPECGREAKEDSTIYKGVYRCDNCGIMFSGEKTKSIMEKYYSK